MAYQPKKMANIYILEILKKHSDSNHRMTQKEIQDCLQREYGLNFDRKSVKRTLMDLVEAGYNLECDYITRKNKNGEDEEIATNWYIENDITDAELKFLIDGVIFSKNMPGGQGQQLIQKLERLSSENFKSGMTNISISTTENIASMQLFNTIEILDEAIRKCVKVKFTYNYYHTDKKLHPVIERDGSTREYIVSPIGLAAANGRYYLVANNDKYDDVSHYRLDRMTEAVPLGVKAKSNHEIKELEDGFDLQVYMSEHSYMYSGGSSIVEFRADRDQLSEIIDWFGKDIMLSEINEKEILVVMKTNIKAFRYWALQYGNHVTVTKPVKLVNQLREDIKDMYRRYTK